MARIKDREMAITLRKKGMSYSQIKAELKIAKSTLSDWLHSFPLPEEKIKALQKQGWEKSEASRERFRNTMRQKKEQQLAKTYKKQKKLILPLSPRDFFIAGLLLYWGEGTKYKMKFLAVSNTDPAVINFFIMWTEKSLKVSREKVRIQLQLYKDMNIEKEIHFWSSSLKIPLEQFNRPFIKKTSSERINHKGGFGHGTCLARVHNVPLAEQVLMGIKVIKDSIDGA